MLLYSHKEVLSLKSLLMDTDLAREYPPALLEICNLVCDKATIEEGISLLVDILNCC